MSNIAPSPQPTDAPAAFDPTPWIPFLGSATAALVALMGVIVLFWLQQAAQRRAERRAAQDAAYARLARMVAEMPTVITRDNVEDFASQLWDKVALGMIETSWHVDARDDEVARWLHTRGQALLESYLRKGVTEDEVTGVTIEAFAEMTERLREWRDGKRTKADFARDIEALREQIDHSREEREEETQRLQQFGRSREEAPEDTSATS